jgi:hypothetical protein
MGSRMRVPTAGQKHLVIVGATGMVGGYVLRYALEHPAVGRVTTIGRRKIDISASKSARGSPSRLRGLLSARARCCYIVLSGRRIRSNFRSPRLAIPWHAKSYRSAKARE